MNYITIVNTNPHEFQQHHCDFSLPSSSYFLGPVVMLHPEIKPNSGTEVEVPAEQTIAQTFAYQGFKRMDGQILSAKVIPNAKYRKPMDYFPGGFHNSNSVIVPDNLEWGELFQWCNRLEAMCQTEFFPIGAAPREEIESFLTNMLKSQGRLQNSP